MSSSALLLALLCGLSSVQTQDLRESDALCRTDGCLVVYFQRKTFLDSWRACKDKGGNLASVKSQEEADSIATLFSGVDLRHSRTKVQVWIGLQRQPRQCTTSKPLRGFSWTTGDQDTEFTNWQREDSPGLCSAPRCVVMSYSTSAHEQDSNFKWLDGPCSVPVDGYLCHYDYRGMCPPLWSEGAGNALYTTPFNLLSTLLIHVPFGSVAVVPCPAGSKEEQSVLCMQKEDGSVGWSRMAPLCSDPPIAQNWCEQGNGGCEHYCRPTGAHVYCECEEGFQLRADGQSCEQLDTCLGAPCQFECMPLLDGYRCACPEGYMLAPDERGCLDVDECLQSPCEQLCVNSLGSFECQCREGYYLDEMGECEDVDECMSEPCENACENTLGSYICHCHLGYSPQPEDPSRCQDTDECQIPGTCEQMCVNYEGGFACYCEEGYELMTDHYSCRKMGHADGQSAVTPPFLWVTHHPESEWDPQEPVYSWNQEQNPTDWPPEVDPSVDWLTDPLRADVIWVTNAPQEELDIPTEEPEEEEEEEQYVEHGGVDLEGGQVETSPTTLATTHTPTKSLSPATTPDRYVVEDEEEEEEITTVISVLNTSTISEGAWNFSTASPADLVKEIPTAPDHPEKEEDQYVLLSKTPGKDVHVEKGDKTSQNLSVTTQPPSSKSETVDDMDSDQEDRGQKQGNTWLLVGLLVPICIFVVVMVALGIIYCTRCAVQPRNKNATDCYHWISGAHDKQVPPNPSVGVKTHV
ncbi:CD248 molecule, endosialin a [Genypterus blacodes]|uniref:CD248 molecule, endosialin a n=1 Tax=Genypterus blacodes TaxID=154954 RepID=UPI003F761EA3